VARSAAAERGLVLADARDCTALLPDGNDVSGDSIRRE
jgi:hypothetical protein